MNEKMYKLFTHLEILFFFISKKMIDRIFLPFYQLILKIGGLKYVP